MGRRRRPIDSEYFVGAGHVSFARICTFKRHCTLRIHLEKAEEWRAGLITAREVSLPTLEKIYKIVETDSNQNFTSYQRYFMPDPLNFLQLARSKVQFQA